MKSGSRRVFRYSSMQEKALPNGPLRRRMEMHRASPARPQGTWTAKDPRSSRDRRRHLLPPEDRMPVAALAPTTFLEMAHRLPLLQKMAHREGTWERTIRERLRVRLKRDPQPSAGVVGSKGRSRAPRSAGRKMIRALRAARRSAVKART
jgi:hypothetical protein